MLAKVILVALLSEGWQVPVENAWIIMSASRRGGAGAHQHPIRESIHEQHLALISFEKLSVLKAKAIIRFVKQRPSIATVTKKNW